MRKLINALLTPFLAFAMAATPIVPAVATPIGNGFYYGAADPDELAQVIEASCRQKGGELGMLRTKPRDVGDRAFARPVDWLGAFQEIDPRAGLKSACNDLPRFFRSLKQADPPAGRIWSACTTSTGYKLKCELRVADKDEKVWVDAVNAVMVMMKKCTNPIQGPEFPSQCYVFSFDYFEQRDVKWFKRDEGGANFAVATVHLSLTDEQMRRMYADNCYFAEDEHQHTKPRPDCPFLFCPPGSTWPNLALARGVGLPERQPNIAIHVWFENGRGRISIPMWAARILAQDGGEFIPCVYTSIYGISVPGFRGWRALARFDRAQGFQIRPTLKAGRYSEVFRGRAHY